MQQTIDTSVGLEFTVSLSSNPSTGYRWTLLTDPDEPFFLIAQSYVPPRRQLPGSGGTQEWTFSVPLGTESGQYTLEFLYKRPWEGPSANQSREEVQVHVL